MSALMSWLFHRGRTNESTGEFSRRSRLLPGEETAQRWRVSPSSIKGGIATDDVQARSGPLIVDLEALLERQSALLEGLTPLHEQAALVSFVGTGISDPSR